MRLRRPSTRRERARVPNGQHSFGPRRLRARHNSKRADLGYHPRDILNGKKFAAFDSINPRTTVTHRQIKDRLGKIWDVWQVYPTSTERRLVQRRVKREDRTDSIERR